MREYKKILTKIVLTIFVMTFLIAFQNDSSSAKSTETQGQVHSQNEILVKYKDESKADGMRTSIKNNMKLRRFELKKKFSKHKEELLQILHLNPSSIP